MSLRSIEQNYGSKIKLEGKSHPPQKIFKQWLRIHIAITEHENTLDANTLAQRDGSWRQYTNTNDGKKRMKMERRLPCNIPRFEHCEEAEFVHCVGTDYCTFSYVRTGCPGPLPALPAGRNGINRLNWLEGGNRNWILPRRALAAWESLVPANPLTPRQGRSSNGQSGPWALSGWPEVSQSETTITLEFAQGSPAIIKTRTYARTRPSLGGK